MIDEYVVIDLEMTGLSAKTEQIIEIGAVKIKDGRIIGSMECLVNPEREIPQNIVELTGITNEMVSNGRNRDEAVSELLQFIGEQILVGQNVGFDYSFLKQWAINHKRPLELQACDTLKLARVLLPPEQPKKLEALCMYFQVERRRKHRAMDDAVETYQIFEKLKTLALRQENGEGLLEPKPLRYKGKKQTPATAKQIERLKKLCCDCGITDEIPWETLTRSEASRRIDKYMTVFRAAEAKNISKETAVL